jgi:ATP adenylyltransferase
LTWPNHRNVLFRPDRKTYVRSGPNADKCVFCNSAHQDISFETLCLRKTKFSQVLLNKYPYNSGHLLILPLRHEADLTQLSTEEYIDLHAELKLAIEALKSVYTPQAINVGMNMGAVSGAGIPDHIHYHAIPRWTGDLNFFPLIANTKVVIESLEESYEKLLRFYRNK